MSALLVGLLLFLLTVAAVCIVSPRARRFLAISAAALGLIVVLVVAAIARTALRDLDRTRVARERIAGAEVQLEGLELSPNPRGGYRLGGFVHNLSTRYTLTDAVFEVIVEDCGEGRCREQARGHAESLRRVPPGQTLGFESDLQITFIPPAAGERRLSYRIRNTIGMPVETTLMPKR